MADLLPPTRKTADASDTGRNCPYCRFPFKAGVELTVCGSCSAAHHEDCWTDNGGCAVLGCAAAPASGTAATTTPLAPPSAVAATTMPLAPPSAVAGRPASPPPAGPPPPPPPPMPVAPARPPGPSRSRSLAIGVLVLAAVTGIVLMTLALSGQLDKQASKTTAATTPPAPPPQPPPAPPDGAATPETPRGVLARVARTCGSDGRADCFVSLRAGPSSGSRELRTIDNGNPVRVVCQRHGENAYSSVLGASSDIWARTPDGAYLANVYLKGDGLNAFRITLPVC